MSPNSSPSTYADSRLAVGQSVYLRESLPEFGLARGAVGAVVLVLTRPEVEFVDQDGETRALATLAPEQVSATAPAPQHTDR